MKWLREHGLISSLADFAALPAPVLEEARLLMKHELAYRESERRRQQAEADAIAARARGYR